MRRQISVETWEQIKTPFASGVGLREIARNMGIAGTVLARSKREGWTQQIAQAKLIERPELARAGRHVARMAGITDKVLPFLEKMEPAEILNAARNVERFDYVARRNYGVESQPPQGGLINLAILTNQAAVQVSNQVQPRPHSG